MTTVAAAVAAADDDADRVKWTELATGAAPYVTVTAVRTGDDGSRMEVPITVTDLTAERTEKCDEAGTTAYTAKVEVGGKSATYTLTLPDVAPMGHQWSDETPVKWSDGMREATLTATCVRDPSHTRTVPAQVTAETITAATCDSAGEVRYTASAQLGGGTVTATTTRSVAPLGHNWCLSAEDANPPKLERVNGVLTATITCRNDASHTWTTTDVQETLVDNVKAATCTAEGGDLYRLSLTVNGSSYVLGEEVRATPASGHSWGEWKTVSQTDDKQVQERTCSVCGETERRDVDATKPAPPKVTVANTADGIKISWTKVEGAVTYRVYYREAGTGAWKTIGHNDKMTYTWKQGTDGKTYEFTVRGVKSKTTSPIDNGYETSKAIRFVKAPAVTVKAVKGGVQVNWTKVAGADTYRVYYKTVGGSWKAIGHNKGLSYTWKHGTAGTSYQFTVRPCTVKGTTKTLLGAGYNASQSVKFPK